MARSSGFGVIRIEGQDGPGQLVHDVRAGGLEDHVLGEAGGQVAVAGQQLAELRPAAPRSGSSPNSSR